MPPGNQDSRQGLLRKKEFVGKCLRGMKFCCSRSWALFTWEILKLGITLDPRFIPWPDTQRFWKKHLNAEQAAFLDIYLPPAAKRIKKH